MWKNLSLFFFLWKSKLHTHSERQLSENQWIIFSSAGAVSMSRFKMQFPFGSFRLTHTRTHTIYIFDLKHALIALRKRYSFSFDRIHENVESKSLFSTPTIFPINKSTKYYYLHNWHTVPHGELISSVQLNSFLYPPNTPNRNWIFTTIIKWMNLGYADNNL